MSDPTTELRDLGDRLDGVAALPRRNGELVFEQPWHSRVFGMAVGLHQAGCFEWDDFRQRLIARIAAWEVDRPTGEEYSYYTHWLAALEDVLQRSQRVKPSLVGARAVSLEALDDHAANDHAHGH